ncbi:MAG: CsgG/HfaB family protein [Treponema sp.]|nr:CsgG/HfaB family protein [Treponema sp.]
MKSAVKILLILAITTPLYSQITLDQALAEAAQEFAARLNPDTTLAVVNFISESERMSSYVIDDLNRRLVQSDMFTVVERRRLDDVKKELDFQMSGAVSDETFQGIGHMLGAETIITGSLEKVDKVYRFRVSAIALRTARVDASYSANIVNDKTTAGLMGGSADLFGLNDYTPLERSGAFFFNLIPLVSVGSWMMGDYNGALISNGIQMAGLTLCIVSSVFGFQYPDKAAYYDSNGKFDEKGYDDASVLTPMGTVGLWTGLGIFAGGYIFNLVRPYHVHKVQPKNPNVSINNLNVSIIPGSDIFGFKTGIAYKIKM